MLANCPYFLICLYVCMYVCCLFNNIEFRANPPLYTIVKYIKTLFDSTIFVLLHIGQKLHTQFLKFSPPSFFMGLEVLKEKSKITNLKTKKDD
jgi:hypothetical protein